MTIPENYPDEFIFYDEMFSGKNIPRPHYQEVYEKISSIDIQGIKEKENYARLSNINQGITFTVYNDGKGIERIFPFDLIPRIIPRKEWDLIESGIIQRIQALNHFLNDIYGEQSIIQDGVIPENIILSCPDFIKEMKGLRVPHGIHTHISGIDIVRDSNGEYLVLEDNLRTPSGISYVLENRITMKRIFPEIFKESNVQRIDNYPALLHEMLRTVAPNSSDNPTIVLLTPGVYNSAYYEHVFLASQMGIQLAENNDLFVSDDRVYLKTIRGPQQVDVIYKRVDDIFLDPKVFRPDSLLGVRDFLSVTGKAMCL